MTSWLARVILKPPPLIVRIIAPLAAVAFVSWLRWEIDQGRSGFGFSAYLAVLVLSSAMFGWRIGLMTGLASLLAVRFLFLDRAWFASPGVPEFFIFGFLLLAIAAIVFITESLRKLVIEGEAHRESIRMLNRELHHRSKNALQILMAVIERGLRMEDPKPYFATLPSRLAAWSKANDLLRYGAVTACELDELVDGALASFDRSRISWPGGAPPVAAEGAMPVALALHELATNATKYGALSGPEGRVSLEWKPVGTSIELRWSEHGGPRVEKPVRHGLGTMLLEPRGALEAVEITYPGEGLQAVLRVTAG